MLVMRLLRLLFILLLIVFVWKSPVFALPYEVTPQSLKQDLLLCANQEKWLPTCAINQMVTTVLSALSLEIMEVSINQETQEVSVGGIGGLIIRSFDYLTINRPLSLGNYIAYYKSRLQIPGAPTPVYAEDINKENFGYNSLFPILDLWVASRNLAYLLFSLIMIVIGVIILLGAKIDPKTAISIQNALPRMIFSLILITFSYAIAGFIVDIIYISISLVFIILQGLPGNSNKYAYEMVGNTVLDRGGTIFTFLTTMNILGTEGSINFTVGSALGEIAQAVLYIPVISEFGGALAILIITVALLSAFLRAWFSLVNAFTQIILLTIFSPFLLLLDAIPGQNQFGGWIRGLLAYALGFPAVILMIFLASALSKQFSQIDSISNSYFVPPLIGATNSSVFGALIAMGIILSIPAVIEMLTDILKAPVFKHGSVWQEEAKTGQKFVFSTGSDVLAPYGQQKTLAGKAIRYGARLLFRI